MPWLRSAFRPGQLGHTEFKEEHALNVGIDNRTHIAKRFQWKLDKLNSKVEDLQASIDITAEEVEGIVEKASFNSSEMPGREDSIRSSEDRR